MGNILRDLQLKFLTRNLHKLTPEAAYNKGNYYYVTYTKGKATALVFFEYAAQHGHVWAMEECGDMYQEGIGCKANPRKALYWYRRCLEKLLVTPMPIGGGLSAVSIMEAIEEIINDLPEDVREWEPLFTKEEWAAARARDNGDTTPPPAQPPRRQPTPPAPAPQPVPAKTAEELFNEGVACYESNPAKALRLFEQVAEMGSPEAQFNCGLMYDKGEGCTQDCKKALYWFEKAAQQGHAEAQALCGAMYYKGEGCTQDYKIALYWLEMAAHQGAVNTQFVCGLMYTKGQGCTKDMQKARYWLQKAADQGDQQAKEILAQL